MVLTIKEYSKKVGKTYTATYRQIHRPKYKKLWEEHHIWKQNNNTYIDDVAQEKLNQSRLLEQVKNDEQLKYENRELKHKLIQLQEQHIQLQNLFNEKNQALIEFQEKENEEIIQLRVDKELEEEGRIHFQNELKKEQAKAKDLEQEIERLKNRSLFERLFNK